MTRLLPPRRPAEYVPRGDVSARIAQALSEIKAQGDGFMLAFPSARGAIDFAHAVQRRLREQDETDGDGERLRVRIGMHTGEAVRVGHDLLGHALTLAARIAAVCEGEQIAVSDLVRQLTERAGDLRFEDLGPRNLKGIAHPQRVHLVEWRDASHAMSTAGNSLRHPAPRAPDHS